MNRSEICQKLLILDAEELYYKECKENGRQPRNLYPVEASVQLTEAMFFPANTKQNIFVLKHKCYSPSVTHSHDFFEIFYVLRGQSHHEIGGKSSRMQEGDLCMIPPKTMHYIHVDDDSAILDILIRPSAFERVFSSLLNDGNILSAFFVGNTYTAGANDYIIFHTGADEPLKNLILDMYRECENKESYFELLLDSQLSMLFGLLLRNHQHACELPPFQNRTDSQIFGMVQYLHQHYSDISLKKLAARFHYTPEYTSKLIHDTTGRTFSCLLTQIRMERALRLLANTSLTVTDIGQQIGYSTPEHFIRTFKKTFHKTPNEYRKRLPDPWGPEAYSSGGSAEP